MTLTICRTLAWLIVIAGVIDPVIAMTLPTRPRVAIVTDRRLPDPALTESVERILRGRFTVVRDPSVAAAVVSVGFQLPATVASATVRAFAVEPEPRSPFVAIADIAAASRPLLQSRLPIDTVIRAVAARGKTLAVTLRKDGVAIDRQTREIATDDSIERVQLQFTPAATGDVTLVIEAQIDNATPATTTLTRTVRSGKWAALFFDRRPSWMSTFVRRAVESDPRFIVTSRVATSRTGPSITAGQPPASLSRLPALEGFDTVVVGAPEDLTDDDVKGLSAFMRERSGSVVLLLDEQDHSRHSTALRQITGVSSWTLTERADAFGSPAASAVLSPASLPVWAEPALPAAPSVTTSVWRAAVGRGLLVVSGALDSWRYRDTNDDAFGVYWRKVIAEGAERSGANEVRAGAGPVVEPDERALIRAWAESRGGRVFSESALAELPGALTATLQPSSERRPTHPMQSPWWMAPFGIVLSLEWWLRRRIGMR